MAGYDSRVRKPGRCATVPAASYGLVLVAALLVTGSVASQEVGEAAAADGRTNGRMDRGTPEGVNRLQDSLATTQEWEIDVPESRPATTFEDRIRTGSALDSQAYIALDSELRRARLALAEKPRDRQAQERLEAVRRALAARVESNMNLGYLYAARVYLALLEDAGAPPDQISSYRRQLSEISQS